MISNTFFGSLGEKVAFTANPLTMISKYYLFLSKSVFKWHYLTSDIGIVLFIGKGKKY